MGEISRRDFLKIGGAAAAGLALRLPRRPTRPEQSEQNKLFEAGLGDYYDVWLKGKKLDDLLGIRPPIFQRVYGCLDGIVSGRLDLFDISVPLLRDKWGAKECQAVEEAMKYINEFSIDIDPTKVDDSPEEVRSFLQTVAKSYPPHVLAMPPRVVIFKNGGQARHDHTAFTTTHDPEQTAVSWIHETTHQFDLNSWEKLKPFTKKESFINYIKTYYGCINDILAHYLNLPEETAKNIRLFGIRGFDEEKLSWTGLNNDLGKQLREWAAEFGIEDNIAISSNNYDTLTRAWSAFSHKIANYLRLMDIEQRKEFLKTNPKAQDAVYATMYGRSFPNYGIFFEGLARSTTHYLVGPVQAKEGGLSDSPSNLESNRLIDESTLLIDRNIELQRVRLASFSRLPPFPTYSQIRESLGLTPQRLHPAGTTGEEAGENREKKWRRYALALLTTERAAFILGRKMAKARSRKLYQKHRKEFSEAVRSGIFQSENPIIIDHNGKVAVDENTGYRLQLEKIGKASSLELDDRKPTVLVLTDSDKSDSVIVFPPLSKKEFLGYGKHYSNFGVLVTGPVFGIENNAFKVAHTPNVGLTNIDRGPGIHYWGKGLTLYFGVEVQRVKLPWNYKEGEEKKIIEVKAGKLSTVEVKKV